MNNPERLLELLEGAIELPPEQRAAYLDAACGNDAALRAEVESLLSAHDDAGRFLIDPTGDIHADAASAAGGADERSAETMAAIAGEQEGLMIGRYKLLQRIGEGGFGTVWMAEQREPVKRRLALKIIKIGMDTRQVIARFEAERQALAMMDHPNIAKVLDAGSTETGRPYFVMEYIKGVPILEYCDTERLDTRERLELFNHVCHAIQHAHQKGIIHRDIKPSNVLVTMHDGVPVPKVIDFGIAKATSSELTTRTLFTEHRQMIGTPAYMSPEQAEMSGLDIDTRSDVYSLGVLLYELLTGTTPFATEELMSKGFAEMMRMIREVEPHKPSTRLSALGATGTRTAQQRHASDTGKLGHLLRGDLDWIVMKCLEKDRTRRYETANGLAADIRRHLNDEPVTAGAPGASYRLRKFVRRNKGPVAAGLLVALVLSAGVIGTSSGLMWALSEKGRADAEKDKAVLAAAAETEARSEADRRRSEAETNLEYARKGNAVLGSVFKDLDTYQNYATVAELRNALAENLERATRELEGAGLGDPISVAELQTTLGTSLMNLGALDEAIPLLVRAGETRRAALGPDDPDTLETLSALAAAYFYAGELDLAQPLVNDTLQRREARFGPNDPRTIESMNTVASIDWKRGRLDRSIPLFEELLQRNEALYGRDNPSTVAAMLNLGANYKDGGRVTEAIPLLEEVLATWDTPAGLEDPAMLLCMTNLADALRLSGSIDSAIGLYLETIDRSTALLGADHPHTLANKGMLAHVYWVADRPDRSVPLYEELLDERTAKVGLDHPDTISKAADLGANYISARRFDQAIALLEDHLGRARVVLGSEHPVTSRVLNNLATAYQKEGRVDAAIPLFEEAVRVHETVVGPDDPNTLQVTVSLGVAYREAGRLELAIPLLEATLQREQSLLGDDHPYTVRCLEHLARAYERDGRLDLAIPRFEQALAFQVSRHGPDHPATLATMSNVATAVRKAGRLDEAVALLEAILERREAKLGRDHPETLTTLAQLGDAYREAGRHDDAILLLEEVHRAASTHAQLRQHASGLIEAHARAADASVTGDPAHADRVTAIVQELIAEAQTAGPEAAAGLAGELVTLGRTLIDLEAWIDAESVLRAAVAMREAHLPNDWRTFNATSLLGEALLGQGRYTEAEPPLLEGYRGMKQREATIPAEGATRIPEAIDRMIALHAATHRLDEVKTWEAERRRYPGATSPARSASGAEPDGL